MQLPMAMPKHPVSLTPNWSKCSGTNKKVSSTIKPREIPKQLKRKSTKDERLNNLHQIQNTTYHTEKSRREGDGKQHQRRRDLGGNINNLHNTIHDNPFIEEISLEKIARCRHRHIENTANSRYAVLLPFSTWEGTVLRIDKTFNLVQLHITIFKHLGIVCW